MRYLLQSYLMRLRRRGHGHLLRHYFLISVALIAGGLLASGLLEIYFRYQENKAHLALLQEEAASVAALRVEEFMHDVEIAMKAAAKGHEVPRQGISWDYRFELKRLFFLAPAIAEAVVLDTDGMTQASLSRLRATSVDMKKDHSASPAFQQARKGGPYFGPIYFVRGSEPYLTVAVSERVLGSE